MSGSRTGVPTIVKLVRHICRLVTRYGAADLAARTTPEFATAVAALMAACEAFTALDDYPMQIDASAPFKAGEDVNLG